MEYAVIRSYSIWKEFFDLPVTPRGSNPTLETSHLSDQQQDICALNVNRTLGNFAAL